MVTILGHWQFEGMIGGAFLVSIRITTGSVSAGHVGNTLGILSYGSPLRASDVSNLRKKTAVRTPKRYELEVGCVS